MGQSELEKLGLVRSIGGDGGGFKVGFKNSSISTFSITRQ